jgi:SAM-dependent methyltransferase
VVHDLDITPWPWHNDEVDHIVAFDVFEHLGSQDYIWLRPWWFWLDECWRILRPGGILTMRLAGWNSSNSWRDPTHTRVFHYQTFHYWDPCSDLWKDYGRLYQFAADQRWWHVLTAGQAPSIDPQYVLKKVGPEHVPEPFREAPYL